MSVEDIVGKCFAISYFGQRRPTLLVGKVLKRFLFDKDGDVDELEMKFLQPKVASGNISEDTPSHLPDISSIKMQNIIAGPLNVSP